jgi:decaprenyl-phosphate phosphoribosyltransferase
MEYLRLLRPYSWVKNVLIFVPLFFARELFIVDKVHAVFLSFVLFCLAASCVYIINDIIDIQQDQLHPEKCHRPLASKKITRSQALFLLGGLLLLAGLLSFYVDIHVVMIIGIYIVLNLAYSFYFKHIAVVDMLLVTVFYLLRIIAGGVSAHVDISHWLILCIIFISLFLIAGKRKAEMGQISKRKVLAQYSLELLNSIVTMSATLAIISYSLYTVLVLVPVAAVYSIFFVLFAILRYLLLIYSNKKTEYPEQALMTDYWIACATVGWIVCIYFILY